MKKPNFLFILTDDQSYWAIGKETSAIISPTLNDLADKGAYFKNFFCACPVCSPARASILTGLMPSTHGIHDWIISGNVDYDKMPDFVQKREPFIQNEKTKIDYLEGFTTYTDILSDNGYNIALSGKWHLGDTLKPRKGYTYFSSILRGGCSYKSYDNFYNGKITSHTEYLTDFITDNAIKFINEYNDEKPFYLGVHYTAPHTPWDKSEHKKEIWNLYKDADFSTIPEDKLNDDLVYHKYIGDTEEKRREWLTGYFSAITGVDCSVKKLIECLDNKGILDDTIIIFTGDNGMNLGQHGIWGKGNGTYPQNMYEESIRVPYFMFNQKYIKPQIVNELSSHVDIFPTLLGFAGIKYNKSPYMWGEDLNNIMRGTSVRNHINVFDEYGSVRMIRTEKYKFIKNYNTDDEILFDLKNDPHEMKNIIHDKDMQTIAEKMRENLESSFENYTTTTCDARIQKNFGIGQKKKVNGVCDPNAFCSNIVMYRDKIKNSNL